MARITTLFVLILLGFASFAQLSVTIENDTLCPNESTWLKASGMMLYGWSDTVHLDTNLGDSVNFTAMTPGTYTITVLGYTVFPQDTDTVSVMIHVLNNPVVSVTSSAGGSICEGSSTELVATAGFVSYLWSPAGSLDTNSLDTVIATPAANTTYYVVVEDGNGCSGGDSIDIEVLSTPTLNITSSVDVNGGYLCLGQSATMTAEASGVMAYEWSPGATLNNTTSMTVTATPTVSTNYMVVITDTNGCTASGSKNIIVNPSLPSLTINLQDSAICNGSSTGITLQTNATSFSWSPGGSLNNPNIKDVIASPTTTTTYSVTVTFLGCTKTGTVTVAVLPTPTLSYTQSSGGQAICLDEEDVITVDCPTCVSYLWKLPNSTFTSSQPVQTISPNIAGAVQVSVTGFDDEGCGTKEVVTINVDSCFVGDPFGLAEAETGGLLILSKDHDVVEFVSDTPIEEINVYNLLGEKVVSQTGLNATTASLSSAGWVSGVYIAALRINGSTVVRKIYLP